MAEPTVSPDDLAALPSTMTEPVSFNDEIDDIKPARPRATGDDDMLRHYSAALDEIYRMRVVAATTARALVRVLGYATLPSGARSSVELARANLLDAARGDAAALLVLTKSETRKANLRLAGAPETLTRGEWEIDHV